MIVNNASPVERDELVKRIADLLNGEDDIFADIENGTIHVWVEREDSFSICKVKIDRS